MKVYAIQPRYDEFKGYLVKDPQVARAQYASARCKGQPLPWPAPLEILADEEDTGIPEADIGMLSSGSLVLTEGAYATLKPVAETYGQLLPLQYGDRTLWLWNITNVPGALDRERSAFNDFGGVAQPVFSAAQIADNAVFKLEEDNFSGIYCTDTFRELVESHQFSGLAFEELDVV